MPDSAEDRTAAAQDEHDCPTCTCFHRAPMQGDRRGTDAERLDGSIAWFEHLAGHAHYGHSQSAERIAERGGFGYGEFTKMVGREPTTWRAGRVEWKSPKITAVPGAGEAGTLRRTMELLRNEVNCRIDHGADSGGHLDYVQMQLDAALATDAG